MLSCYHPYLFNEITIRQIKLSLPSATIVVVKEAILRLNCNPYAISNFFSYYFNFISLKATLVVNVASYCQYTDKNYIALQELHREFGPSHFTVLAFPCNQFGESEPSSSQEIESFAKGNYGVTFPVFHKIKILGSEAEPAFKFLIGNCFLLYIKLPVTMVFSLNPSPSLFIRKRCSFHSRWRETGTQHTIHLISMCISKIWSEELYPENICFSSPMI